MQEASDKKKLIGVVVLVAVCVAFLVWQLMPSGTPAPSAQDQAAETAVQQKMSELPPSPPPAPVSGGKTLMGGGKR